MTSTCLLSLLLTFPSSICRTLLACTISRRLFLLFRMEPDFLLLVILKINGLNYIKNYLNRMWIWPWMELDSSQCWSFWRKLLMLSGDLTIFRWDHQFMGQFLLSSVYISIWILLVLWLKSQRKPFLASLAYKWIQIQAYLWRALVNFLYILCSKTYQQFSSTELAHFQRKNQICCFC